MQYTPINTGMQIIQTNHTGTKHPKPNTWSTKNKKTQKNEVTGKFYIYNCSAWPNYITNGPRFLGIQ